MGKRLFAIALIFAVLCTAVTGCVKVVPLNSEGTASNTGNTVGTDENFDASAYIAKNFQSQFVPELDRSAVDFAALMQEANGDLDSVGEKYGRKATSGGSYNFVVKGTAEVREVNTQLRAGYMALKIDGYAGDEPVQMQVGPVFKGTSLRDSIPSIKFDDFRNQVTYANLSTEVHKYITQTIFAQIKADGLKGKTIEFSGTFANDGSGTIAITPYKLKTD